jgi:hypothetical protein
MPMRPGKCGVSAAKSSSAAGFSDQIVDRGTVPGASLWFARRLRQRDPPAAAHDVGEIMNSEWIAFANKQCEAAIP